MSTLWVAFTTQTEHTVALQKCVSERIMKVAFGLSIKEDIYKRKQSFSCVGRPKSQELWLNLHETAERGNFNSFLIRLPGTVFLSSFKHQPPRTWHSRRWRKIHVTYNKKSYITMFNWQVEIIKQSRTAILNHFREKRHLTKRKRIHRGLS